MYDGPISFKAKQYITEKIPKLLKKSNHFSSVTLLHYLNDKYLITLLQLHFRVKYFEEEEENHLSCLPLAFFFPSSLNNDFRATVTQALNM